MDILGHVISHWRPASKYNDAEANNLTPKTDVTDVSSPPKFLKIHKTTASSLKAGKNIK
jgi:hypothetical protein